MKRQTQFFTLIITISLFLMIGCVQSAKQKQSDAGVSSLTGQNKSISSSERQMTGAELNELLGSGKTLMLGGEGEGYKGELILLPDGTGKGQAITDKGEVMKIEGTWEIVGDEFCRVWKEVSKGEKACERWIIIGENKVEVRRGDKKVGVNSW